MLISMLLGNLSPQKSPEQRLSPRNHSTTIQMERTINTMQSQWPSVEGDSWPQAHFGRDRNEVPPRQDPSLRETSPSFQGWKGSRPGIRQVSALPHLADWKGVRLPCCVLLISPFFPALEERQEDARGRRASNQSNPVEKGMRLSIGVFLMVPSKPWALGRQAPLLCIQYCCWK